MSYVMELPLFFAAVNYNSVGVACVYACETVILHPRPMLDEHWTCPKAFWKITYLYVLFAK